MAARITFQCQRSEFKGTLDVFIVEITVLFSLLHIKYVCRYKVRVRVQAPRARPHTRAQCGDATEDMYLSVCLSIGLTIHEI